MKEENILSKKVVSDTSQLEKFRHKVFFFEADMRDRTKEFFDCVQTFSGVVVTRPHKLKQDPSQFGEAAKKVSERIVNTTARVKSLAKLVTSFCFHLFIVF